MKTLIFDFDGTIADTFSAVVRIANELASEYGIAPVERVTIERFRNMTLREILRELHIPVWKVPALALRGRRELRKVMADISPFPAMQSVLSNLSTRGSRLGILSSNAAETIHFFLEKHTLDFFDFVHSEDSVFGKHRALRHIMKKYSLGETWYIGDEVRDIEGAKKAGLPVVAVTWGYQDREILEKHEPDFLIDRPAQLLDIF